MWYAINGNKPEYEYSYGYQNWYESAKYETINARKNVALFELSPFAKFELNGDKAHSSLQHICANNMQKHSKSSLFSIFVSRSSTVLSRISICSIEAPIKKTRGTQREPQKTTEKVPFL